MTIWAPGREGRPAYNRRIPFDQFLEWRARTGTLSSLIGTAWDPQVMATTPRGTARLSGMSISPEWFTLLGVNAMLGRTLQSSDQNGAVVVLSARAWRQYFDANPGAVGTAMTLDARRVDVIGVMPDSFEDPSGEHEFWVPIALAAGPLGKPVAQNVAMLGQLAPGVTTAAAAAEGTAIMAALQRPGWTEAPGRVEVETLREHLVAPVDLALRVLVSAVGVVLLVVCANLASLLLARGTARRREMAVRLAIGAGRGRLVRQMLAESAVLATLGGILGVVVTALGLATIRTLGTIEASGVFRLVLGGSLLPRLGEIGMDAHVLLLAVGVSAAASLFFGLVPALRLSRVDALQAMGARSSPAPADSRVRGVLVVGQLVMATVLLVGGALVVRSFVNLSHVDMGYQPSKLLAFQLALPNDYSTDRKAAVVESILAALRSMPGLQGAGFAYAGALVGVVDTLGVFAPPGRSAEEMRGLKSTPSIRSMSYDYLATMGVQLLEGRHFSARDDEAAPFVVVLNRSSARQLFGTASAVGATLVWDVSNVGTIPVEVVGVVEDMRHGRIDQPPIAQVFFDSRQLRAIQQRWKVPQPQQNRLVLGFMSFVARTAGEPAAAGQAVRAIVAAADPAAGIDAMAPLEDLLSASISRPRFYSVLLGFFAAVAAVLAAVGLYGVLAYAVVQRTREIGVRMALGAERGAVLALVLGRGLLLAAIGLGVGIAVAAALSKYVASLLFGVTPLDPITYGLVAAGFAAVALVAAYLPARRATAIDPVIALRCE